MIKKIVLSLSIIAIMLSLFFGGLGMLQPTQAQGGVTTFNNLNVINSYRANKRANITVTQDMTVTVTGTYQPLTSAGAVSFSGDRLLIRPEGTILVLVNVGSNTITITETANIKSAGNIALGALDTATLISDGADWYQLSGSNN